ncbi:Sel1 repeat-containing protein [Andreprevotia lacus DSM 23236]|jgi:TPR repeat protein|uniref:Sel1 repeat-containing protein n=1 Tax=Andreprevotia lacus DSM 23236 TaxID=1121001 RepID=A0A1W1XK29_9NEIS|nr:tetratricopeptide repeat protein [Andreprevotia lacus]SMC24340.1 Sel1 repeat-containing protein [Andreprevotia lacus DSM 23236]
MAILHAAKRHPRLLISLSVVALATAGGLFWQAQHRNAPDPALRANTLTELRVMADSGRDDDALAELQRLADKGTPDAQRTLGQVLLARGDSEHALTGVRWLQQAGQAGDADAYAALGKAWLLGSPGLAINYPQAHTALQAAAKTGHTGAAYYLGIQLKNGYGIPADAKAAAHWFEVAARNDEPAALFMLANAYRYGDGVANDDAKALALYRKSADLEYPPAIQAMAMAYQHGEMGLKRDPANYKQELAEAAHALKHPAQQP